MYMFLILMSFSNRTYFINGSIVYLSPESIQGKCFGISSQTKKSAYNLFGSFSYDYFTAKHNLPTRKLSWSGMFSEMAIMWDIPKSYWYIGVGINNYYKLRMRDEHISIGVNYYEEVGFALDFPIIGVEFHKGKKKISIHAVFGCNRLIYTHSWIYGVGVEASKHIFPMYYVKIGIGYKL